MKKILLFAFALLLAASARAEYRHVDLTVFGMDCAPCAHAIHVAMKGISGVDTVDVDLNTGAVSMKLSPNNTAAMRQFNEAVEKNGFTHKEASVLARGKISGTAAAPVLEITGTSDHYALTPAAQASMPSGDVASLLGKTVDVDGTLPQAGKGKIPGALRYKSITAVTANPTDSR